MLTFPSTKDIRADPDLLSLKWKQKLVQIGWGQYDFAISINSPLHHFKERFDLSSNVWCKVTANMQAKYQNFRKIITSLFWEIHGTSACHTKFQAIMVDF